MLRFYIGVLGLLYLAAPLQAQTVGPDPSKRYQVFGTHEPDSCICRITVFKKTVGYHATGFLVSGNVLVSAGHVFRETLFSRIKKVTINIGRHNGDGSNQWLFTGTYRRNQLRILKGHAFAGRKIPDHDYTFVALPEVVSSSFFQTGEFAPLRSIIDSLFITGFPEDKGNAELWQKGDRAENITEKSRLLLYSIYTWQADSGAPVWCRYGNRYYAVGIHSVSNYRNIYLNAGLKFGKKDLSRLRFFIQQNNR
jgi:V8-like Glu-specific endopeptidase